MPLTCCLSIIDYIIYILCWWTSRCPLVLCSYIQRMWQKRRRSNNELLKSLTFPLRTAGLYLLKYVCEALLVQNILFIIHPWITAPCTISLSYPVKYQDKQPNSLVASLSLPSPCEQKSYAGVHPVSRNIQVAELQHPFITKETF